MIDIIRDAYCFFEAEAVCRAQTEKRFSFLILKASFYSFFINLIFCLPCFLQAGPRLAVIIIWIIFSFGLFSLILYRLMRLSAIKTGLGKIIESKKSASESFMQSLSKDIIFNLIFYSSILIFILVYFSIIYILCSFFISGSFLYYSISLLVIAVFCGICLFAVFFHFFAKDKDMLWPKIALPLFVFVVTLIALFFAGFVCHLDIMVFYICPLSAGWWFTLPLLKQLLNDRKIIDPFRFAVFIHAIAILVFLLSFVDTEIFGRIPFAGNPFLNAPVMAITRIINSIKSAVDAGNFFFYLLPHLFIPVLIVFRMVYDAQLHIMDIRRKRLFDEKISGLPVFSSGLSLYPVIGRASGFFVISIILFLEISPLSQMLFSLVDMLKVVQVFHLTFLTVENIRFALQLLFIIVVIVFALRLADSAIMHILSMFILFPDELVFVEQRILRRSILRIPLSRIHFAGFYQHLTERLFDTGSIRIESQEHKIPVAVSHIPLVMEKYRTLLEKIKSGQ